MVDKNELEKVINMVLLQEATSGLSKKEKFLKNCLVELNDLRNKTIKEITLTMRCPECNDQMQSTANLQIDKNDEEFNLDEFEGMDYECSCGYKTHILAIEPRNEHGYNIY
jgi:hypothetical protein